MLAVRAIPILLYGGTGLVKSIKFKDPKYVGDPINAVKIFNEKEVDEIVLLDITATPNNRRPDFRLIASVASECFMPMGYGGGIQDIEDIKRIFKLGVEKVSINSAAISDPELIRRAADISGSQSIVVSIDVKKNRFGRYEVYTHGGRKPTGLDPVRFAGEMQRQGAGEILLNSIDRDGTMQGYDLDLIGRVTGVVGIPVIACGGAGKLQDLADAVHVGGASAAAAGSFFVFHGKHRAVLISYPSLEDLIATFRAIRPEGQR